MTCGCRLGVDSVEKSPKQTNSEKQLNLDRHLHSTFAGLTIRFRTTYVASALGHAPLRVLVRKTPPGRGKNLVGYVDRLFQHNRHITSKSDVRPELLNQSRFKVH